MIKKGLPFLLIFGLAILFSSCKKDSSTDTTSEPGANSTGTFTATIGALSWQASKVRAYRQDGVTFTRISGTQAITNTSSPFSAISIYVDMQYITTPSTLEIGVSGENHFYYDAQAHMDCTLRSTGAVKTYTAHYVVNNNFSAITLTTLNSSRIEGGVEFRSINTDGTPDTIDVRGGAFSITF